jgi:ABC-type uncharacterized transport system involved in gliding motility auxiliary subunit
MGGSSWFHGLRGAAQAAIQVLLVLALFATVQFLAGRHNLRFDLTPTKRLSLSPYARQAVEEFEGSGTIYAFYDSQRVADRRRMYDLLDEVHSHAPHLGFELVDLDRRPGLAKKYKVSNYDSGVLELENGTRHPLRSITEESITATLLRLSRDELGKICFVLGHGEGNPRDTDERTGLSKLTQAIQKEGFAIDWLLTVGNADAADCTVLTWVSPTHGLAEGEAEAIIRRFRNGGRALFFMDPGTPPSFTELLRKVGIALGDDVIVDESNRMLGASSFVPHVDRFRPDIFRDRLRAAAILPIARTVRANPERDEDISVISLAGTSETTWARVGASEVPSQEIQFRPTVDDPGPLSIAVRSTIKTDTPNAPGQIIVVGDSDFVTNDHIDTLGNRDFALGLFGVVAEEASMIGMRREDEKDPHHPLSLTAAETRTIFWVSVIAIPALSVAFGTVLGVVRRRHLGGR